MQTKSKTTNKQDLTRVAEEATSVPVLFVAMVTLPLEFSFRRIRDTLIIVSGSTTMGDPWLFAGSTPSPQSARS